MGARCTLTIETRGPGLYEVTSKVASFVSSCGIREGLCVVFCRHTSASLVIQENADPSARRDLETFLERLAPEGASWHTHTAEGPDDMPSHLRSALTKTSETFIVEGGRLLLGPWQGLFLCEHRRAPHTRTLEVKVLAG